VDGSSQNEKNEQGRTEQKCAESVHGQNLLRRSDRITAGLATAVVRLQMNYNLRCWMGPSGRYLTVEITS
jgi:hypothetical protein